MDAIRIRREIVALAPVLLVTAMLVLFAANDRRTLGIATVGHFVVGLVVLAGGDDRMVIPLRKLLPVILPFTAAAAWAAIPLLASTGGLLDTNGDGALILLQLFGLASLASAGAVIGRSAQLNNLTFRWLLVAGLAYLWLALTVRAVGFGPIWGCPDLTYSGRFTGTMLNANVAGCSFGMIALLAIGHARSIAREGLLYSGELGAFLRFGAAVLSVAIGLAACAITQSRSALLLTMGGLMLLTVPWFLSIRSLRVRGGVAFLVGAAFVVILLSFGVETARRGLSLGPDGENRFAAYRALVEISRQSPWIGWGLGSFSDLNLTRMPPDVLTTTWNWGAAHNIALHGVLEAGWPFVVLIALTVAALGFPGKHTSSRDRHDPMTQSVDIAILLAIGCALVDIALNAPAIASFTALLLGLHWGRRLRDGGQRPIGFAGEAGKPPSSASRPSRR